MFGVRLRRNCNIKIEFRGFRVDWARYCCRLMVGTSPGGMKGAKGKGGRVVEAGLGGSGGCHLAFGSSFGGTLRIEVGISNSYLSTSWGFLCGAIDIGFQG